MSNSMRTPVLMHICRPCNQALNQRFEEPARPLIDSLMRKSWGGPLARSDWITVGQWWSKVLILLAHPSSRFGDGALQNHFKQHPDDRVQFDPPLDSLSWMTNGQQLPPALSLFVYRADPNSQSSGNPPALALPREVREATGATVGHCQALGLSTAGIGVVVVWHPGLSVDHPHVRDGRAWELIRGAPVRGNLEDLHVTSPQDMRVPIAPTGVGREGQHFDGSTATLILSGLNGWGHEDWGT